MSSRRSGRSSIGNTSKAPVNTSYSMSRPRRIASGADSTSMATVSRAPVTSSNQQSLRLTVKLPASKLRAATGLPATTRGVAQSITVSKREQFVGGEILEGKRPRNVKKSYVLESDSDEEDEEMEDVGEEDDDAEGESVEDEEDLEADEDEDAEGEDDADGDIEMESAPRPPIIKISMAEKSGKPTISLKQSGKNDVKAKDQKTSEAASDDEELSELESEVEEEEEEEGMQLGAEEDADGEDEEMEGAEDDEDEDDLDSDDETPAGGSRASTPDLSKLTKRQRARLEEGGSGHLLALPDEVQVKKHLTAEEHAMRRAEMARRRKNLSEKRNEEEKMETINKLLKKQAPKTNARRRDYNGSSGEAVEEGEFQKPNPVFVRWVSNRDGNRIGVPEEWIDGPAGALFGERGAQGSNLIEEVQ